MTVDRQRVEHLEGQLRGLAAFMEVTAEQIDGHAALARASASKLALPLGLEAAVLRTLARLARASARR